MGGVTARSRSRDSGTRALRRAFGVLAATGICLASAPPALAAPALARPDGPDFGLAASSECVFGGDVIKSTPWSLQRILLDQLREQATGKGVTVAVIDTGVDASNVQLREAMASGGGDYVGSTKGTQDLEGHGTRVAGIIAARPLKGTGFVGLAPEAKILSFRYTGGENKQGNSRTMSSAIRAAVAKGAKIINISSDTANRQDNTELRNAVAAAVQSGALIVAAAGNDGADGKAAKTYPASYPGVLAVAASDRNDERAYFSQAGDFVDVAAPGVDMVSTVPKGGQCTADGTSFATPYVAGVAALLKEKHPNWTAAQLATRIEETAQRPGRGPNQFIGWGVVDPVAALSEDSTPSNSPKPDAPMAAGSGGVIPMAVTMGESEAERERRVAVYVLGIGLVLVLVAAGSGVALRDWRTKRVGQAGRAGQSG
ncbi:type VII secretion-associated serine protease mycosin [Streptomyces yaanensis]|uniref:Type VII secretion-associated serine protease mycosin n=1 Tax=Streptomyces yaanensis TaxID=1142239 RepID=A0ABV7SEZ4_9ACTN|nr:type VII secretion-associated serine protease mycosin [Streptomyces sp. CGMCC 4.7035]WNB98132.1 type VII secretion-associated serine protease mycosin [Streptomyces sp. CGMCC 4.7035]